METPEPLPEPEGLQESWGGTGDRDGGTRHRGWRDRTQGWRDRTQGMEGQDTGMEGQDTGMEGQDTGDGGTGHRNGSELTLGGFGWDLGRNCSLAGMEFPDLLWLPLDPWQCPRPGWTLGLDTGDSGRCPCRGRVALGGIWDPFTAFQDSVGEGTAPGPA